MVDSDEDKVWINNSSFLDCEARIVTYLEKL